MLERAASMRRDEEKRRSFWVAWNLAHWVLSGPPPWSEVQAMLRGDPPPPARGAQTPEQVAAFCRSLAARGLGVLGPAEVSGG